MEGRDGKIRKTRFLGGGRGYDTGKGGRGKLVMGTNKVRLWKGGGTLRKAIRRTKGGSVRRRKGDCRDYF